ncbi:MAG: hypothetical protein A2646_01310 [Candidatus Portnoybacteria bacterium RIFCSPHIGHO2_02_FULL_39_12]|nr:MAG: hypothetical protein A2646_01310 [Candidatus Portnoybacteria bacterium RIFCSPHIGHO2_02_FULL_39_12]
MLVIGIILVRITFSFLIKKGKEALPDFQVETKIHLNSPLRRFLFFLFITVFWWIILPVGMVIIIFKKRHLA